MTTFASPRVIRPAAVDPSDGRRRASQLENGCVELRVVAISDSVQSSTDHRSTIGLREAHRITYRPTGEVPRPVADR